jgi:hypothetical protein
MKIIGKYKRKLFDFIDCNVIIDGKFIKLFVRGNTNFFDLKQPKQKDNWKFRKINSLDEHPCDINRKTKFKHVIEYYDKDSELRNIFIKANFIQLLIIKNNQREKPINLKLIVCSVTIFVFVTVAGFILNDIYNNVKSQILPRNHPNSKADTTNQGLDTQSIKILTPSSSSDTIQSTISSNDTIY